jgi:hypothetical protein
VRDAGKKKNMIGAGAKHVPAQYVVKRLIYLHKYFQAWLLENGGSVKPEGESKQIL